MKKPTPIPKRPPNPGFIPNSRANMSSNAFGNGQFKKIYHPSLGRMINSEHPEYFKFRKSKRKISPNVGLRLPSCATFAKGDVGPYIDVDKEKEVDKSSQEPTK